MPGVEPADVARIKDPLCTLVGGIGGRADLLVLRQRLPDVRGRLALQPGSVGLFRQPEEEIGLS